MVEIKTRPRKTVDDYMHLPEGVRAELIEGELFMTPSPKEPHQNASGNLFAALRDFVRARRLGKVYAAPFDVHLPSGDIVQPDVVFVSSARADIVRDWVRGTPDLLIEVLSPEGAERDRIIKRGLYARNGVTEYWIVDAQGRSVEVLTLSGDRYSPHGYFEAGDKVVSPLLPGLELSVADIFA